MIQTKSNSMKQKIAYFSMEIALSNDIHTYSGGLGVLAGDSIRSSADLRLPLVAVTLLSKKGYFKQELTPEGKQLEHQYPWNPSEFMLLLPEEVKVQIQGRDVRVTAWLYTVKSQTGGVVPVYFLDTDVEGNNPEDREISSFLYGGDERYRLKQEIVLGFGGVRMLEKLGIEVRRFHLNEGHSSLLTFELLRKYDMDFEKVKDLCVFTTHTPIEAGHDKFSYGLVEEVLGDFVSLEVLKRLGGYDRLNMTLLALNLSNFVNGVAKRHQKVTTEMFPSYEIHAITNGVHPFTWTCESFQKLYDEFIPGWAYEPSLLVRVDAIPDEKIWQAHKEAKKVLIDHVNKVANVGMDYEVLTIGFARRATEYKRANLLFSDIERLKKITLKGKIQIIFAGKAHPKDYTGKGLIEQIYSYSEKLRDYIKIVYLENYDMATAAKTVAGVDIWLNTPMPPQEASGTSGMKAALNGVINFSVLDGWWIEGWIEGVTGWAIGPNFEAHGSLADRATAELDDLYNKLEYVIIPMFYNRKDEWVKLMKNSMGKIPIYFNSHRMMRRYVTEAYL